MVHQQIIFLSLAALPSGPERIGILCAGTQLLFEFPSPFLLSFHCFPPGVSGRFMLTSVCTAWETSSAGFSLREAGITPSGLSPRARSGILG